MNITIEELTQIIKASCAENGATKAKPQQLGQNIVVLDRGFVYVGDVEVDNDFVNITNAKNIRYWGTKKGLGELTKGPLPETKLDEIGMVKAPLHAVIHFVPCTGF